MKKKITVILSVLLCVASLMVIAQSGSKLSAKQERREVREKRRADKQAAFEKSMDSIILSHNFQFNPQTMQRQIAGSMHLLSNPNFSVGYWDGTIDVFLPYIKGIMPPYHSVILNYTIPSVQNYVTEQTASGWLITFETSLFSAGTYTFSLDVSTKYGGATLTLKNPFYNTVQYTGTISQLY